MPEKQCKMHAGGLPNAFTGIFNGTIWCTVFYKPKPAIQDAPAWGRYANVFLIQLSLVCRVYCRNRSRIVVFMDVQL